MNQRGRKSAAKLAVVTRLPSRPKPPRDMTDRQAEHWKRIAASMTATWFTPASQFLLADLCRWTVRNDDCEWRLRALEAIELPLSENAKVRKQIVDEATAASRMIMALETKLRLTPQSQRSPDAGTTAAKRATADKKPWE